MKKLLIFIICICGGMASMQAQNTGNAAAIRKLQMAEFAIANLYVDSVDENKLVEEAIIRMLALHIQQCRGSEENERASAR